MKFLKKFLKNRNKSSKKLVKKKSTRFVYMKENGDLMGEVRDLTASVLSRCAKVRQGDSAFNAKNRVRDELDKFIFERTKRKPMILPVIKYI